MNDEAPDVPRWSSLSSRVTFDAHSSRGMSIDALSLSNIDPHNSSRKKIKQVEPEIQRLTAIRHQNVVGQAHHPRQPQLVVQLERSLDAADMSEDCSALREERAVVSFMVPPYLDDSCA